MVSNACTTRKSSYNCYHYDGNTSYKWYYIVFNEKKVRNPRFLPSSFSDMNDKTSLFKGVLFFCFEKHQKRSANYIEFEVYL